MPQEVNIIDRSAIAERKSKLTGLKEQVNLNGLFSWLNEDSGQLGGGGDYFIAPFHVTSYGSEKRCQDSATKAITTICPSDLPSRFTPN